MVPRKEGRILATVVACVSVLASVVWPLATAAQERCGTCIFTDLPAEIYVGKVFQGRVTIDIPESCYQQYYYRGGYLDWGDGATSSLSVGSNIGVTHSYASAGEYPIRIFWYQDESSPMTNPTLVCSSTNTRVVPACAPDCAATVEVETGTTVAWEITGVPNPTTCQAASPTTTGYTLDFGDGSPVDQGTLYRESNWRQVGHHEYPSTPKTYTWKLTAHQHGYLGDGAYGECTKTGTVTIGPQADCMTVGSLKLCADQKVTNGDTTTFTGSPRINDTLWCTGSMVFKGDPLMGTGTLTTDGDLFVKLAGRGDTTVLTGPGISYQVDGTNSRMTLTSGVLQSFYSFTLQGVTLHTMGSSLIFVPGALRVNPLLYVGNPAVHALATLRPTLTLPTGGEIGVESCTVVNGSIQPYYTLSNPDVTFTGGLLNALVDVHFPSLGTLTMDTNIQAFDNCLDHGYPRAPLAVSLDLNEGGLKLGSGTLEVTNICNGPGQTPRFKVLLGGTYWEDIYNAFRVESAEAKYDPINERQAGLWFRSGHLLINGSPVALRSGIVMAERTSKNWTFIEGAGTFRVGTLFDGEFRNLYFAGMRDLDGGKAWLNGVYRGKVGIPQNFECSPSQCPQMRTLVKFHSLGVYPYVLNGRTLRLAGTVKKDGNPPFLEDTISIGSLPVTLQAYVEKSAPTLWRVRLFLGGNPFSYPRSNNPATPETSGEHTWTFADQTEWAIFSAVALSATPDITLKTPSGQTVTPATVGNFAGIRYFSDADEKVAFFSVQACPAGTWTLGVTNLPESEVTFQALGASPPPVAGFAEVTQSGDSVAIRATLTPATPEAKVTLSFSSAPDGAPIGVIAADLTAASGEVQANWDTSLVPTGAYYLIAEGDDGASPLVTTFHPEPVVMNHGGPWPPAGLSGSFVAGTATLQWIPSSDPSAAGAIVLFREDPSLPGYTSEAGVSGTGTAVIEDLDPARNYRFAVVATDAQGNRGPLSDSWTTAACAVGLSPVSPSAAGVGQAVSFAAHASSVHCGADPLLDWDFGDGSAHSAAADPVHTYAVPGNYVWTVTASSGGVSESASGDILVSGQKVCALACSATVPLTGKTGEPVSFLSQAIADWCLGDVTTEWDFGDGTPAGGAANESHVYTAAGTYAWKVGASLGGNRCARAGFITIAPGMPGDCDGDGTVSIGEVQKAINMFLGSLPPGCGVDTSGDGTVSIGEVQKVINAFLGVVPGVSVSVTPSSETVLPGGTQQFSATVTGSTNTAVSWSVVEGPAGGSVSPAGFYTAPATSGTYHVKATSQADPSKSGSATVTVTQAPTCTLNCTASCTPNSGQAPLAVSFTTTATPTNCSGAVAYAWTFGDGGSSSQQNPSHTYPAAGTFTWTMMASVGDQSCSKTGSITVTAGNQETPLTLGTPVAGSIVGSAPNDAWKWYTLDLAAGDHAVDVDAYDLTGDLDLYVRTEQKPDLNWFTCRSWRLGVHPESCKIYATGPVRIWIGITNQDSNQTINYSLRAALPGTCSLSCTATAMPTGGLTVQFAGQGFGAGCVTPTFNWDFGEGGNSEEAEPTYTYPAPGTYNWNLYVHSSSELCASGGVITVP
jgi:PKD repeat protein